MKSFTKVFTTRWNRTSPTPVTPDKAIYKGAIPGMLRTLDPHSNFFDPKDFEALREDQKRPLFRRRHAGAARATARPSWSRRSPARPPTKPGLRPGRLIMK